MKFEIEFGEDRSPEELENFPVIVERQVGTRTMNKAWCHKAHRNPEVALKRFQEWGFNNREDEENYIQDYSYLRYYLDLPETFEELLRFFEMYGPCDIYRTIGSDGTLQMVIKLVIEDHDPER